MKEPVEIMDCGGDSEDSNTGEDTQANRATTKPTARPITKPTARLTSKPTGKPSGKPSGKGSRKRTMRIEDSSSEDEDENEDEDEDQAAAQAEEVACPPKPKHNRKRARVSRVESEPEDHPPVKKSNTTISHPQPVDKPATGSGKSSGHTHKSPRRSFGPMSGIQTRAQQQKQIITEAAPPAQQQQQIITEAAPAATGSGVQVTAAKEKRVIKPSLKNSVNKYTYR